MGQVRGKSGQDCKVTKRRNISFSSCFRSEFHFREDILTVSGETPFLYLLAFLSRLSWAIGYLSE